VLHAAAGDGVGDAALGGEPKDKIADEHERSWDPRPEHKVAANGRQIDGGAEVGWPIPV
jgi:hypothetical protein